MFWCSRLQVALMSTHWLSGRYLPSGHSKKVDPHQDVGLGTVTSPSSNVVREMDPCQGPCQVKATVDAVTAVGQRGRSSVFTVYSRWRHRNGDYCVIIIFNPPTHPLYAWWVGLTTVWSFNCKMITRRLLSWHANMCPVLTCVALRWD